MKIRDLFEKDINRSINGVIKADQLREDEVYQEIDEFVVTRELIRHFHDFYASYNKSLNSDTDKIGVWISGFFGSGKSHFLKMLSYLLENNTVKDKQTIEFFKDKLDKVDPLLYSDIKKPVNIPTDAILFNIDSKSRSDSKTRKNAIVEVFLKVFNERLGYCAEIPWLANIERVLDEESNYDKFKEEYKKLIGTPWEESRNNTYFARDYFIQALCNTKDISTESAAQLFDNADKDYSITPENFAKLIKKHLDSKGKNHRIVFLVDEIGQYISDNTDLMLNLQTVTENLGTYCQGRAWVIVTSQEAIDTITKERFKDLDFSKIQGRFDTRLNLSAANTDEVIRKRLLEKKQQAKEVRETLSLHYIQESASLRNLISFSAGTASMKSYRDEEDFIQSYPFIPYQFDLLQKVFECIRNFSHAGKHLSDGNRSMLNAFHTAAMMLGNNEVGMLVPFNTFYKTLESFLDTNIKRIFDKAIDYLDFFDIEVLKVLFMIKYVKEMPSNVDNITTLMISNINESKTELRNKINGSLTRLKKETLIQQNGEEYDFLTDEEQDVNRGIKRITVEFSYVLDEIAGKIFEEIYNLPAFSYTKQNVYRLSKQVDNKARGKQGEDITIKVYTPESEEFKWDESRFKFTTDGESGAGQLIIKMPDDKRYIDEIYEYLKTEKFVKEKSSTKNPENVQKIIDGKYYEIKQRRQRVTRLIEEALLKAEYYASGSKLIINNDNNIKLKIEAALKIVTQNTFHKLSYIQNGFENDRDVHKILTSSQLSIGKEKEDIDEKLKGNFKAEEDMRVYITQRYSWNEKVTVRDISNQYSKKPYGWALYDVAGILASLYAKNDIKLEYNGENLDNSQHNAIVNYLIKEKEFDKLVVIAKQKIDQALIENVKKLSRELFNAYDLPDDGEELAKEIKDKYITRGIIQDIRNLLPNYNAKSYPGKSILENGITSFTELEKKRDANLFLTDFANKAVELNEWKTSFNLVNSFLTSQQKAIFDRAIDCINLFNNNDYYLEDDEIKNYTTSLQEIVRNPAPYTQIKEIPDLAAKFISKYNEILNSKKAEIRQYILNDWGFLQSELNKHSFEQDKFKMGFDNLFSELEHSSNFNDVLALKNKSQNQLKVSIDILNKKVESLKIQQEQEQQQPASVLQEDEDTSNIIVTEKPTATVKEIIFINPSEVIKEVQTLETEQDVDRYLNELGSVLKSAIRENKRIKIS